MDLHQNPLKSLLIIIIFFTSNAHIAISAISGNEIDKSALLEFKSSVSDPSGVLRSWNRSNSDVCSWFGVSCGSGNRVVALNITGGGYTCDRYDRFPLFGFGIRRKCVDRNAKLIGELSDAISKVSELRVLSLAFNDLIGEIGVLWRLKKLEVIDLEGNSINGSLNFSFGFGFGGFGSVRVLNLGFNRISGEIPDSLVNLKSLRVLNLAGNRISGSIPRFFNEFVDLKGLYLSFNRLTGRIPSEIGYNCGNLERLELSGNFLLGGIPASLSNCSKLRSVLLYSNMLQGEIPTEIGRLRMLQVLDVSRNSLGGVIPRGLGNCKELSVLVLSNLLNPIPNDRDSGLVRSQEEFNYFRGALPTEITILPKLRLLWAPRATLEGKFPNDWGACRALEMVNLGRNLFTDQIPNGILLCKKLRFLDLSSNQLTGELNDGLPVPCMNVFDVSRNRLSGSIPSFRNAACKPFDLDSQYLRFFAFQTENDGGNLAIVHNFGGNNFTGELSSIPVAPKTAENSVYTFLAAENQLNGRFPGVLFDECSKFKGMVVNLSSNRFSGEIPSNIGRICRSLRVLDVSRNRISGIIPSSFGELRSLVALNLSQNLLQGEIPVDFSKIKDLRGLSLSGNNLTGPIPTSFGKLQSLEVLELFSNSLSGPIPEDLVNLRNLTVLLLNNNKLSGPIPSGFTNVTGIVKFNVSVNDLSGLLPGLLLGNLMAATPSSDQQSPESGRSNGNVDNSNSSTPAPKSGGRKMNSIEVASITSASAVFSVFLALGVLFLCTRWRPNSVANESAHKEVTLFTDIGVPLTFENVITATGSFNANNCIGNGGFGATYKAEIAPGFTVAIKTTGGRTVSRRSAV
ncbi:hypothetical protein OSB04_000437 [Centaurea solstitialis]|uniref:Leucine-rich repeat-containing N-terminal plant-type domain-containing protein n=1 Tax=Centaurea solstitialis TaxID=347529 RepID=A0AA38WUJ4_9ASTR|nr:hypothetical protein OSB04_000437 [Centaurea solstitialis]